MISWASIPGMALGTTPRVDIPSTPAPDAISDGLTVIPAAGNHFQSLSRAALTLISGGAPHYVIPARTAGLDVDEYGNVRMGPNVLGPTGAPSTWDTQKQVPDFLWDQSTLRVRTRTLYATEIGDPAELGLGRFGPNNSYPYNDGNYNNLTGLDVHDVIGFYEWFPAVAPFGGSPATPGAKTYGRSASIYARTSEAPRVTAADGSTKAQGTHVILATTATGTSGTIDALVITQGGVLGSLANDGFDYDNVNSLGLARGTIYARSGFRANATGGDAQLGPLGPGSEPGIALRDFTIYRSAANVATTTGQIAAQAGYRIGAAIAGGTSYQAQQAAGDVVLRNLLLAADTNPAFRILGSGRIEWGAGAGAAPDSFLYRSAAAEVTLQGATLKLSSRPLLIISADSNCYLEIEEVGGAAPGTPGANRARLYTQDNGAGKTQLIIKFDNGTTTTIATEG